LFLFAFLAVASAATVTFTLTHSGGVSAWNPTNSILAPGDTVILQNSDTTMRRLQLQDDDGNQFINTNTPAGSSQTYTPVIPSESPYTITATARTGPVRPAATTNFFVPAPASAGDPHFRGFDNKKFNFQGEPNKNFALLSDPWVEINARFEKWSKDFTVISQVCVRLHEHTIKVFVNPNLTLAVEVDGLMTKQYRENEIQLQLTTEQRKLAVSVPNWNMTFHGAKASLGAYLNFNFMSTYTRNPSEYAVSGVMGHTLKGKPAVKDCNPSSEGSCEVIGKFQDYEVADLCGTDFLYSQFIAKK